MVLQVIGAFALGLVFAGLGFYMYWNKKTLMEKAVPVKATVLDTRIREDVDDDPDGGVDHTYYPVVRYEFTYNGGKHQSNSVYPGGEQGEQTEDAAEEIIADYNEGAQVEAYVNPDDPSESFLIKTSGLFPLIFAVIGLVILGIGVMMLI